VAYRILICFAGALFATVCAGAQTGPKAEAPKAAAVQGDIAAPTYAETPDGLKKLIQDLFDTEKTGDTADRVKAPASVARGRFRGIYRGCTAPSLPAET
jgi:hypothetical protein